MEGFGTLTTFGPNGTDAKNFLGNITTLDYQFVSVFVHSNATMHGFMPYSKENDINSTQIRHAPLKPLFYNLYACSAVRFDIQDNLGTSYLFSSNTLAVVGQTRIGGGMWFATPFYGSLGHGAPIGYAMQDWFNNNEMGPEYVEALGITLLGDPLLVISN